MQTITIPARAKINLYLRVGDKRPDGYHDIQTIFHSIDLTDTIEISRAVEISVTTSNPDIPDGPMNLAHRAAALLQQQLNVKTGARIHITKQIPSQAGLGGGSADAAATLVALNRLWNINAPPGELERMGASLGADVPFCVRGGAAYAEGIGERLTTLPPLAECWIVVIKPKAAIPTRAAYEALDSAARSPGPSPQAALDVVRSGDASRLPDVLYNDFQPFALAHFPEIHRAHAALRARMEGVLLSGSGAALFGLAPDRSLARRIALDLRREGWSALVSRLTGPEV